MHASMVGAVYPSACEKSDAGARCSETGDVPEFVFSREILQLAILSGSEIVIVFPPRDSGVNCVREAGYQQSDMWSGSKKKVEEERKARVATHVSCCGSSLTCSCNRSCFPDSFLHPRLEER